MTVENFILQFLQLTLISFLVITIVVGQYSVKKFVNNINRRRFPRRNQPRRWRQPSHFGVGRQRRRFSVTEDIPPPYGDQNGTQQTENMEQPNPVPTMENSFGTPDNVMYRALINSQGSEIFMSSPEP